MRVETGTGVADNSREVTDRPDIRGSGADGLGGGCIVGTAVREPTAHTDVGVPGGRTVVKSDPPTRPGRLDIDKVRPTVYVAYEVDHSAGGIEPVQDAAGTGSAMTSTGGIDEGAASDGTTHDFGGGATDRATPVERGSTMTSDTDEPDVEDSQSLRTSNALVDASDGEEIVDSEPADTDPASDEVVGDGLSDGEQGRTERDRERSSVTAEDDGSTQEPGDVAGEGEVSDERARELDDGASVRGEVGSEDDGSTPVPADPEGEGGDPVREDGADVPEAGAAGGGAGKPPDETVQPPADGDDPEGRDEGGDPEAETPDGEPDAEEVEDDPGRDTGPIKFAGDTWVRQDPGSATFPIGSTGGRRVLQSSVFGTMAPRDGNGRSGTGRSHETPQPPVDDGTSSASPAGESKDMGLGVDEGAVPSPRVSAPGNEESGPPAGVTGDEGLVAAGAGKISHDEPATEPVDPEWGETTGSALDATDATDEGDGKEVDEVSGSTGVSPEAQAAVEDALAELVAERQGVSDPADQSGITLRRDDGHEMTVFGLPPGATLPIEELSEADLKRFHDEVTSHGGAHPAEEQPPSTVEHDAEVHPKEPIDDYAPGAISKKELPGEEVYGDDKHGIKRWKDGVEAGREPVTEFVSTEIDPDAPSRCVDGRPDWMVPQGPQMLGGVLLPTVISAISENGQVDAKRVAETTTTLTSQGHRVGVHHGSHENPEAGNSDCGFADRLGEIINNAVGNREEIIGRLLAVNEANPGAFNMTNEELSALLTTTYDRLEAYDRESIKLQGEELVGEGVADGAVPETVLGNHAESAAIVNLDPKVTFDTRMANGAGQQAFNLDLHHAVEQARALGVDPDFATAAALILYAATERTLRQGEEPLPIIVHTPGEYPNGIDASGTKWESTPPPGEPNEVVFIKGGRKTRDGNTLHEPAPTDAPNGIHPETARAVRDSGRRRARRIDPNQAPGS